jgi:hypothetical protein
MWQKKCGKKGGGEHVRQGTRETQVTKVIVMSHRCDDGRVICLFSCHLPPFPLASFSLLPFSFTSVHSSLPPLPRLAFISITGHFIYAFNQTDYIPLSLQGQFNITPRATLFLATLRQAEVAIEGNYKILPTDADLF